MEKVETKNTHTVGAHYALRRGKLVKISGYTRRQHDHWKVCPHCGRRIDDDN